MRTLSISTLGAIFLSASFFTGCAAPQAIPAENETTAQAESGIDLGSKIRQFDRLAALPDPVLKTLEGSERKAIVARNTEGEEVKAIVGELAKKHQCSLDIGSASVRSIHPGDDPARYVLVEVLGQCAGDAMMSLTTLLPPEGAPVTVGQFVRFGEEKVRTLELLEVENGSVHTRDFDSTTLASLLGDSSTANGCSEDAQPGVGCAQSALSSAQTCWICKQAAGLLIGSQLGQMCGGGAVAICGALGITTGAGGLVCLAAAWGICKIGASQLGQLGGHEACKLMDYCP